MVILQPENCIKKSIESGTVMEKNSNNNILLSDLMFKQVKIPYFLKKFPEFSSKY